MIEKKSTRVRASKPPYRVPSMKEIAKLRGTNGFKIVTTFSGCGGSCLGFEMAGFEVVWANEFIPAARETYKLNHPGVLMDKRDIREVTAKDILRVTGLKVGELDVLEGSPPCASFSTAGKREAGWGTVKKYSDAEQRTDDLFFEYARLLEGLQPRVFVAENVSGLVKGTAKGYFKMILARLKECGYRVSARVLDAQWLGVPQTRQRLIFVGVRNDLNVEPAHPSPLPYRYSVAEACPWICISIEHTSPKLRLGAHGHMAERLIDLTKKPSPIIMATGLVSYKYSIEDAAIEHGPSIEGYAIAAEAKKLLASGGKSRYLNLSLAHKDRPSPTVTAIGGSSPGVASVIAPDGMRKFSIAELKRICAFPDDFKLTGSYAQQWERLGRAVPPLMMRAVARTVKGLLERIDQ